MATCNNCIYHKVCTAYRSIYLEEIEGAEECDCFEDKANYEKVVKCKDCDIPHNKWTGCPKMNGLIPPPDHFCSFGRRKG